MKAAKLKKINNKNNNKIEYEEYSIKKMLKIILIITLILGTFYIITYFVVNNRKESKKESHAVIDSSKMLLSSLFAKTENEYYVLATMPSKYSSNYQSLNYDRLYENYISKYKEKDDSLNIYFVNLDDALNKNYISDKTNISNDLSELKLSDDTLLKITSKEIESYYVGKSEIINKLTELGE